MKPNTMYIAFLFAAAGLAGTASAAGQASRTLPPVHVTAGAGFAGCVPLRASQACDDLRRAVLANFTRFELGMIYGNGPEYWPYASTGASERARTRLVKFLERYGQERVAGKAQLAELVAMALK